MPVVASGAVFGILVSLSTRTSSQPKKQVQDWTQLEGVKVEKVLLQSAQQKRIAILGKSTPGDEPIILTIEKLPFSTEHDAQELVSALFGHAKKNQLTPVFRNDIYSQHTVELNSAGYSAVKIDVVYPAPPREISKWTPSEPRLLFESAELYDALHRPFAQQKSQVQWVKNILDGTAEVERVAYSDPDPEIGFMLVADPKAHSPTSPYLQTLVRRLDLFSVRDLRGDAHLSLLRNLRDKIPIVMKEKFGLEPEQIRLFFHYAPSYYHLHLHVTGLAFTEASAGNIHVGRALLLQDVIQNLEMNSLYYASATLPMQMPNQHPLYQLFEDHQKKQKQSEEFKSEPKPAIAPQTIQTLSDAPPPPPAAAVVDSAASTSASISSSAPQ